MQQDYQDVLHYRLGRMNSERYWVERPDGRILQLDQFSKEVLTSMAAGEQLQAICKKFDITEEDIRNFYDMLGLEVGAYFLLEIEDEEHEQESTKSAKFYLPFIDHKWCTVMTILLACCSISLLGYFILTSRVVMIGSFKEQWIVAGALTISVILHEFGHLLAMPKNRNISLKVQWSGPIPLLSIICNEAWKLSRFQKIRINLGGFISDIIICGILATAGILMRELTPWIWTFLIVHIFRMVFAILPVLPGDGYWLLVDLFNQPNLAVIAKKHLRERRLTWFSFFGIMRTSFLGLIWGLYGFVLVRWSLLLFSQPLHSIWPILIKPISVLFMLNIANQLYGLYKYGRDLWKKANVKPTKSMGT